MKKVISMNLINVIQMKTQSFWLTALLVLLGVFSTVNTNAAEKLMAGTGKVNITPPNPRYPVHDSLYARTLILEAGASRIAFVSLDLVMYSNVPLAEKLKKQFGLQEVYFCPQHTHSGEAGPKEWLDAQITKALKQASSSMFEARISAGYRSFPQLSFNRLLLREDGRARESWVGDDHYRAVNPERIPHGPVDNSVGVIKLEEDQAKVDRLEQEIEQLKQERKRRSAALQRKLFEQFRILNARGEVKDLCELFAPTSQGTPPAGAGECAAPKLLQYAYQHQLEPIAMAEFWWGDSPKTEIRHHGYYYPACKGKCEPILHHMLQGLRVDENPLLADSHRETKLDILYEDDYLLVINKPEGMLSVPGKGDADSVYQRLSILYPEATGPIIVHRLDMATSGLLLAAKTKEAHQNLQAQFKNRTIQKRYIALLEGEVPQDEGEIRLPLCPDPLDRPRQIVSEEFGKPALTHYRVLERTSGKTLIAFYPQTGRTHQLRVHAAHPQGLHCPILGDKLYGRKAERLYLHAEYLAFTHPITSERIEIQKSPAFPRCPMP